MKRYDGPAPILRRVVKGKRHIVPRTLQVEEVPIRRTLIRVKLRIHPVGPRIYSVLPVVYPVSKNG